MDVQQALLAAGYTPEWGYDYSQPGTLDAAIRQFQAEHGLTVDGIVGPNTLAALQSAGTVAGTGYGSSIDDVVNQRYGYMSWALSIPGVGDVLHQGATEGWDATRIQGAIQATDWWKTTSAASRQWAQLSAQDPATAAAQREAMTLIANDYATSIGLPGGAGGAVDMALKLGLSASEMMALIRSQSGYYQKVQAGQKAGALSDIQLLSAQYGVPISSGTASKWAEDISLGFATMDGFSAYVREQAKSLFPSLAAAIDSGITVRQYVEPYVQIAAQELGINPNSVDIRDPKFNQALHQIDPTTGKPVSMSLSQWTATVRSDPRLGYDKSQRGQESAYQLAEALNQRLGNVA